MDTMAPIPRTKTDSITDEELERLSNEHSGYRFERVNGGLQVKSPVKKYSAYLESKYLFYVGKWAEKNTAEVYGSQAGFKLPNGDVRSPDISVLLPSHPSYGKKIEEFISGAPVFLIEIRSHSDSLSSLQEKMEMWIQNGCGCALLVDYRNKTVYEYRPNAPVTEHPYDSTITCEDVLPGFSVCPAEVDT
jgi:Uma2 family endonuclease